MKFREQINNPLTIIAIFAGIAEISSTTAILFVNKELQYIFIWFVIGFPILLVVLFFITLLFKPKVLYSPSDFRSERNFLIMMGIIENRKKSIRKSVVKNNDLEL